MVKGLINIGNNSWMTSIDSEVDWLGMSLAGSNCSSCWMPPRCKLGSLLTVRQLSMMFLLISVMIRLHCILHVTYLCLFVSRGTVPKTIQPVAFVTVLRKPTRTNARNRHTYVSKRLSVMTWQNCLFESLLFLSFAQINTTQYEHLRLMTSLPRASLHRRECMCCVSLGK